MRTHRPAMSVMRYTREHEPGQARQPSRENVAAGAWDEHGHSERRKGEAPADFARFDFMAETDAEAFRRRWGALRTDPATSCEPVAVGLLLMLSNEGVTLVSAAARTRTLRSSARSAATALLGIRRLPTVGHSR